MKKFIIYIFLVLALPISLFADDTKTVGTTGADYPTLSEAFFDINSGILTGVIILQIIDNTTETATAELFENGYGATADYTSVTVYPVSSGLTIGGDIDGPLISLTGADNVTIDGRVGATGSTKDLVITNTSTGASATTIQFSESATTNTVKYCIIKGSETGSSGGVIFFSTASSGSGNDGNTIDNNDITSDAAGRPVNAIYSSGTSGSENSGNTISNNNIYNFLKHGTASNGILFSSFTTSCTISGNSFYETASFAPAASVTYNVIKIDNASGTAFTVTGNFIGGQSATCGGSAWTKTNAFNNVFYAVYMNVGTGSASSIQNNTIKNFSWSNSTSAAWTAIHINAGAVNIGTATGNTIGAATGTGSVTVTGGATGANVFGINIASGGTVDCENNIIGSITAANTSTLASNITGINKTGTAGTTTISNNTIGSTSTASSIIASSGSTSNAQTVIGINTAGTGTITINGNTIANLTNNAANISASSRGRVTGIASSNGANTISSNTIHDLTIANANDASNQIASVCGIALNGNTSDKTVSLNTIYNLSNTYTSFVGSVIGLFFNGSTGTNAVKENFIHNLTVTGASSTTASVYGINIFSGVTTYSNNIISLGGNTKTTIYGIYETGTAGNNNSLYFNTVYIGGDGNGGTNKSYALFSAVNTNTRNFRNNLFLNARSTTAGSDLHFAAYIVSTGGSITCDYNDYRVSGTYGGTLGYYGGIKTALPIVTGQDVSSFAINPGLANPGGTAATDYLPSAASLVAVTGTGITTDYPVTARSGTYPAMGAYEYTVAPGAWTWTGLAGTDWNTAANWNYNTVPPSTGNVIIADVANDPIVNEAPATPAECEDLTINTAAVLTIAAGKELKVDSTLANNAGITGLVIRSNSNGNDGKLINNTASVPATVELYLSGGAGTFGPAFHYFVPPVASMNIGNTINDVKTNLSLTNFNGDLMAYSEPAAGSNIDLGWQYFDGYTGGGVYSSSPFSSISSSKGYNIYLTANDKITFTGLLNGPEHTFSGLSFTNQGWNLVGNPYPCNYRLNGISELINTDNVDNTVYFNHDGGYGYLNVEDGTFIGAITYSDTIAPMQGFFVKVNATSSITLPVDYKTSAAPKPLRSKGASSTKGNFIKKIKLALNNGTVPDETVVCLIDDATTGFDGDHDAYKLFGSSASVPYIYTQLNSVRYAINAVKGSESTPIIIPVTVVLKSPGTYNIDISEFENLEGINVILKHGVVETTLSKDASYSFTSGAGTFTDFELIIGGTGTPTAVEPVTNEKIKTWFSNNYLYINCPDVISTGKSNLVIYDLQGKPVYTNNMIYITPGQTIQLPLNLPEGVYITRFMVNNQSFVSRIVVF